MKTILAILNAIWKWFASAIGDFILFIVGGIVLLATGAALALIQALPIVIALLIVLLIMNKC